MKLVNIQLISSTEMSFQLDHIDFSIANAIRRIMMSEVETFAIDEVEFIDNTTILPNEFIAHRLGLIPVKAISEMTLELDISNIISESGMIITSDAFGMNDLFPYRVPIVKVKPGQTLQLKAHVISGIGLTHSKWNPVCKCVFRAINESQFQFEMETIWDHPQTILKKTLEKFSEKLEKLSKKLV